MDSSRKYPSLFSLLTDGKSTIVREWMRRTMESNAGPTPPHLSIKEDPLRNPAGQILRTGLSALWDGLVSGAEPAALEPALTEIIKLRAVQELTPAQAVSFVLLLKHILRESLQDEGARVPDEIRTIEQRIDALALQAFDAFTLCRERIQEIRVNEVRRMQFLPQRVQERSRSGSRIKG